MEHSMFDRTTSRPSRLMAVGLLLLLVSCVHAPVVVRGPDFSVYQADRVRVYLAAEFPWLLTGGSPEESRRFYQQTLDEIGVLFERTVLTGEMFFKALGEQPANVPVRNLFNYKTAQVDEILGTDKGPLMKLLNYQDISDHQDPKHRRYDLWVTFTSEETGMGAFHHFTLLLENRAATGDTSVKGFARGARVTSLTYEGIEL